MARSAIWYNKTCVGFLQQAMMPNGMVVISQSVDREDAKSGLEELLTV